MKNLDGRHKLAIVGAIICWALSVWFSCIGFSIDSPNIAYVGWVLAAVVTIVELVFNSQTGKLSLTLIAVGIMCYAYGIWTNVTGFWTLQNPNLPFVLLSQNSIMPALVGIIMEILPEPLLMWGLMSQMDGDFIGNLMGLWSGKLSYAQPIQSSNNHPNKSNYQNVPNSIPKKVVTQMPMGFSNQQTTRPAPKPQFNGGGSRNPTYHAISRIDAEEELE